MIRAFVTRIILFTCTCMLAMQANAQLVVNNAVNAPDGVQNVLLGAGVTVSNITFSGVNEQIGSFTCSGGCNLNLGNGLIMGSGNVDGAPGNGGGSTSSTPSSGFGASDPDLVELSGNTLNDAAVLQFDFVAVGATVSFNFVFGSDEYPEFANSGFNDAFGFFLSGAGISGPYLNNAANIALIPGTVLPVTINNLNNGTANAGPCEYCAYYIANNTVNVNTIECDGFTTVLTATADVICGETYHIKLAIADAGDTGYDSYVFLEGSSFASTEVSATMSSPSLSPPGGGIYEGCQPGSVVFTLPEQATQQIFDLSFSGMAQYGIDFDSIPEQIIFPANQNQLVVDISAIADGVLEGTEILTITVMGATSCGNDVTVDVVLSDLPDLVVNIPDVPINCGQEAILTPQISGGLGNYLVNWTNGPVSPTYSVFPDVPTSYNFTITDTCGVAPYNGVANVVFIDNAPIVVNIGADQQLTCLDSIFLSSIVSGGFGNYYYEWTANGGYLNNTTSVSYQAATQQNIVLTVTDDCEDTGNDTALITYPAVPVNVNLGADLSVTCLDITQLSPVVSGGVGAYSYNWSSQQGNLGSASSVTYQTNADASIVLEVTDECGNVGEDQISIAVPQVAMLVDLGPDLTVTCLDQNTVTPQANGGVGSYTYQWTYNFTNVGQGNDYSFSTNDDATLTVSVEDECGNSATDEIEIDVPAMPVTTTIGDDLSVTCIDINNIIPATSGGVGTYSYQWNLNGATVGIGSSYNVITDQDATLTVTVEDECGNTAADAIDIDVPPVTVTADAGTDISTTCITINTLNGNATGGVGVYNYTWTDITGVVGGSSSVNYQAVENTTVTLTVTDQCNNVDTDEVNIDVPAVPVTIDVSNDTTVCVGEHVTMNALAWGGMSALTYEWDNVEGSNALQQHYYLTEGQPVIVTATDLCGNTATATAWINVVDVHPSFMAEYLDDNTVAFTNLTHDASYMEWHFSDSTTSTEVHPVHQFLNSGVWSATLIAVAELGCTRSLTQEFAPLGAVFVPNCFTPDGDGINDFLFAVGHDIVKFEWWIYNRWGQEIYHSTDMTMPWDGAFKSNEHYVPDGTYSYRLVAWGQRDNLIEQSGHVTILR
ncbi:MAG: choice-of-anchor L domain-containing protein [Flavobacteriales bacterium]